MVEKVSDLKPPKGITRQFFRAPIWLYDLNLGWLMGNRALRITHIGRVSGKPRHVEKSDWVKNIRANPNVQIQVGREKLDMVAEQITPEKGEAVILEYAKRHPTAMKNLAKYMGYQLDGSEADFRELGRQLLIFALIPQPGGNTG
jgi:hypothetical protein